MAKPTLCDQCGCELSEEEFRSGRAFRDRADVLCAKCYEMYQEDERRRERERKRRDAAAAIEARAQARRGGALRGHGGAGSSRGTPKRGATRAITTARRSGKSGGSRELTSRIGLVGAFIAAAVVAFVIAVGVLLLVKRSEKRNEATSRPGARPADTRTKLPPPAAPEAPSSPPQKPPPTASKGPEPEAQPEQRRFRKSLFGPGGQFDAEGRRR